MLLIPVLLAVILSGATLAQRDPDTPLRGFSRQSSAEQLKLEGIFSSVPSAQAARQHHATLTERPHVAGQKSQRQVAEYVLGQFQKAGIEAQIVEYQAYIPYPKSVAVRLLEPEEEKLELDEESYSEDKYSSSSEVIKPFHAYSPSAEIEGEVVYVNYGLPEDYVKLKQLGVDVRGKIALSRYGRCFRGVKVKVAEENGVAGVLIYSDPMDDGYFQGDVFPKGPYRPESGIQRGSVEYIFIQPGDPLTPGKAAIEGATRITADNSPSLPKIPSQPLSYQDARVILNLLQGPVVPKGWQGALPFTYHVGPGPSRVRMDLEMDYAVRPIWNVIGKIPGSTHPEEWIVLGNHIDAWNFGAVDANSGTTALLMLVEGLGKLLEQGFKPKRTIVLAGWDGEEYGLIGSTEWGEELQAELSQKAVAYLNVDVGVSGSNFDAAAIPALQDLVREATQFAKDPKTGQSVYQTWLTHQGEGQEKAPQEVRLGDLGSGSDYTVFIHHLGIPSVTMGFEGPYGVYHSLYDNHYWMSRFGDPTWQYHPAMAEIWGRVALRLANAEVIPFDYGDYGRAILRHLQGQQERDLRIQDLALEWQPLMDEARNMEKIGDEISAAMARLAKAPFPPMKARRINALFLQAERAFLLEKGLPRRPWYRHSIYAPGFYSGYASKPLPALSEAIDEGQYTQAELHAGLLLERLRQVNQILDQIRRLMK